MMMGLVWVMSVPLGKLGKARVSLGLFCVSCRLGLFGSGIGMAVGLVYVLFFFIDAKWTL